MKINMIYAKLINGRLQYFTEGETVLIGDKMITNPTIEVIIEEGYKQVIYTEGNRGIYEDNNYIIIEIPTYSPPIFTPAQLREKAYREDKVIEWNGELLTCDEARLNHMSAYYYSGQLDKLEQLQKL